MALLTIDDENETPLVTEEIPTEYTFKTQGELETSVVFNKETEVQHIINYVGGSKWEVDFFLQIRDINDSALMPDINTPATVLKYNRINKLVINLESAIDQSNVNEITGEGIINAGFLPNYGDAFKAVLTGGQEAVFVVEEVEKKSYNTNDTYFIKFKLYSFLHTNVALYNDLVNKTMKVYVYDKNHLQDYSMPILLEQEYKKKLSLKKEAKMLIDFYLRIFVHNTTNTIAPPTKTSIYVDTLLNDFLFKFISIEDNHRVMDINKLDFYDKDLIGYTIWNVILHRDIDMLSYVTKNIGFRYSPTLGSSPVTRSIGYLGIGFAATLIKDDNVKIIPDYEETTLPVDTTVTFTPPLGTGDSYYVLSDSFYDNDVENCGLLETSILQYLKGERVNDANLEILLNEYKYWTTEEKYYLIPILLLLVKDSISHTYSDI